MTKATIHERGGARAQVCATLHMCVMVYTTGMATAVGGGAWDQMRVQRGRLKVNDTATTLWDKLHLARLARLPLERWRSLASPVVRAPVVCTHVIWGAPHRPGATRHTCPASSTRHSTQ